MSRAALAVVPPAVDDAPGQVWFSTEQAAAYAGCHPDTVRRGLADGDLHGQQRTKPKGRWRIHRACIDAWCDGQPCAHAAS